MQCNYITLSLYINHLLKVKFTGKINIQIMESTIQYAYMTLHISAATKYSVPKNVRKIMRR